MTNKEAAEYKKRLRQRDLDDLARGVPASDINKRNAAISSETIQAMRKGKKVIIKNNEVRFIDA